MYLKYPQWQEPVQAAIVEFQPKKLAEKLKAAEAAITRRIQQLSRGQKDTRELEALFYAQELLDSIRQDRLFPESKV
jgi:hypothetical protein